MPVRITEALSGDLPELLEIERASQLEPWSEAGFEAELKLARSRILVARRPEPDCRPLGFLCLWVVADELQVLNVAVFPEFRRLGIGTALLRRALELGREAGLRAALLEVREHNVEAARLYRRFGFSTVGERRGYYGDGRETAILMELPLDEDRSPVPAVGR